MSLVAVRCIDHRGGAQAEKKVGCVVTLLDRGIIRAVHGGDEDGFSLTQGKGVTL